MHGHKRRGHAGSHARCIQLPLGVHKVHDGKEHKIHDGDDKGEGETDEAEGDGADAATSTPETGHAGAQAGGRAAPAHNLAGVAALRCRGLGAGLLGASLAAGVLLGRSMIACGPRGAHAICSVFVVVGQHAQLSSYCILFTASRASA